MFNRENCIFCKIYINFYTEQGKIISIDLNADEDGASVKRSVWSHIECLPDVLKEVLHT